MQTKCLSSLLSFTGHILPLKFAQLIKFSFFYKFSQSTKVFLLLHKHMIVRQVSHEICITFFYLLIEWDLHHLPIRNLIDIEVEEFFILLWFKIYKDCFIWLLLKIYGRVNSSKSIVRLEPITAGLLFEPTSKKSVQITPQFAYMVTGWRGEDLFLYLKNTWLASEGLKDLEKNQLIGHNVSRPCNHIMVTKLKAFR